MGTPGLNVDPRPLSLHANLKVYHARRPTVNRVNWLSFGNLGLGPIRPGPYRLKRSFGFVFGRIPRYLKPVKSWESLTCVKALAAAAYYRASMTE